MDEASSRNFLRFLKKEGRVLLLAFSILFGISFLLFRNLILRDGWPAGGDALTWVARVFIFGKEFRWLKVWRPYSFGFVEGIQGFDFTLMIFNFFFQSGPATVKFFMFFCFLLSGISIYALTYYFHKNHLASFAASQIYMLNNWILTQYTEAHIMIIFAYSMAPFLFLILDLALERDNPKYLILLSLGILLVLTGFNIQSSVIYMIFLLLYAFIWLISPESSISYKDKLRKNSLKILASIVMVIFSASFFILPTFTNLRSSFLDPSFGYDIEEATRSSHRNLFDAFTLQGVESWGYIKVVDVTKDVALPILPVPSILMVLFTLSYLTFFIKTDRRKIFFLLASFLAIFLSKGPYPPFENIFRWSWYNLPYFSTLRAANRLAAITGLCHAFFTSNLIAVLLSMPRRSKKGLKGQFNTLFEPLNRIQGWLINFSHYSSRIIVVLIFLSGVLSGWFFFVQGFQNYTPLDAYISPYEWFTEKNGDFKIITASKSPSEWTFSSPIESDFATGGMMTNIGWGHDIGQLSAFIHDKTTLHDGGWDYRPQSFMDHLRFRQVRKGVTDQLYTLLGIFNYKYVVLPPYITEDLRELFLNQKGGEIIYDINGSQILENPFHQEKFFTAKNYAFVLAGGYESLFNLLKIPNLNLSRIIPFYLTEKTNLPNLSSKISEPMIMFFIDKDLTDLLLQETEKFNVIPLAQYGNSSKDFIDYWGRSVSWRTLGLNDRLTLSTRGVNKIDIPLSVENEGSYDILLHIGFRQSAGTLRIGIDNVLLNEVKPETGYWGGVKWFDAGTVYLEKGSHTLNLIHDGRGWSDVDAIATPNSSEFEREKQLLETNLEEYKGKIIQILTGAHTFTENKPKGWQVIDVPYKGAAIKSSRTPETLSSNFTVFQPGNYVFTLQLIKTTGKNFIVNIDDTPNILSKVNYSGEYLFYESEPINLETGTHTINIENLRDTLFDQLIIYKIEEDDIKISIEEIEFIENTGWRINTEGVATASSEGTWGEITLNATNANDGNEFTRWASRPHDEPPQWLQIEWAEMQDIFGVQMLFESAHAEDYSIQYKDEDKWIDILKVENNTELDVTHYFPEVKTKQIRLHVTEVIDLYDLVSVWEFKVFTGNTIKKIIDIPKTDQYKVAVNLVTGPDYGSLKIEIAGEEYEFPCNSPSTKSKQFTIQSISLRKGEQEIGFTAKGNILLESLLVSNDNIGNIGFLDNFGEIEEVPSVEYEKTSPCEYYVKIQEYEEPVLLVFSETHHDLWKAETGNDEISTLPAYNLVNSYLLQGENEFRIYFKGQNIADLGIKLSTISIIILLALLLVPSSVYKRVKLFLHKRTLTK